jgi:hypothetical protein
MYYEEHKCKVEYLPLSKGSTKLRGPFRNLCIRFDDVNAKRVHSILNALRSYTIFVSRELLPEQEEKFINSVENPLPTWIDAFRFWKIQKNYFNDSNIQKVIDLVHHVDYPSLDTYKWRDSRFKPLWSDGNITSVKEGSYVLEELLHLYKSHVYNKDVLQAPYWQVEFQFQPTNTIKRYVPKYTYDLLRRISKWQLPLQDRLKLYHEDPIRVVGKVAFLQEAGYKLRAVANPFRIHQVMLQPLGDFLFRLLRLMPWDATYNQDRFTTLIQNRLSAGLLCYSIDLSDATNVFPLNLQRECFLRLLTFIRTFLERTRDKQRKRDQIEEELAYSLDLLEAMIHIFECISRAPWAYKNKEIKWKKGQPLGLYPSFPLFAWTHGMLLYSLAAQDHVLGIEEMFCILGDDVIILDDKLHQKYMEFLKQIGVPISEHKSISSSNVAEFAGRIIDKYGSHQLFKWRFVSEDNFIDLIKNFGSKIISMLPRNIRQVAEIIAPIPDVVPFGLGINPKGLPFLDRLKGFEDFIDLYPHEKVCIRAKRVFSEEDILEFYSRYSSDDMRRHSFDVFTASFFSNRDTTVKRMILQIDQSIYPEFYDFMKFIIKISDLYSDPTEKARYLSLAINSYKERNVVPEKWLSKFISCFEREYHLNIDDRIKRDTMLERIKKWLYVRFEA